MSDKDSAIELSSNQDEPQLVTEAADIETVSDALISEASAPVALTDGPAGILLNPNHQQPINFVTEARQRSVADLQSGDKPSGSEVVDKLFRNYEGYYVKKYPFERGIYHQCIPNPLVPNGLITVQLITRTTSYLNSNVRSTIEKELNQTTSGKACNMSYSQTYTKHAFVMPDREDNEGSDDQSLEDGGLRTFGGVDVIKEQEYLNADDHQNIKVDDLTGISYFDYAKIEEIDDTKDGSMAGLKMAIVAFWVADPNNDGLMRCYHYFEIPNPMKRVTQTKGSSDLYEILYTGQNGEVFMFFDNINSKQFSTPTGLNIAVLNMDHLRGGDETTVEQFDLEAVSGYHNKSNRNFLGMKPIRKGTILDVFLREMDKTSYSDQKQTPNPTLIEKDGQYVVVFTAYMKPADLNLDESDDKNVGKDPKGHGKLYNWFPSIHFYGLDQNRQVFQIAGAEVFIGFDNGLVTFMQNTFWQNWTKESYLKQAADKNFSPITSGDFQICTIRFKENDTSKSGFPNPGSQTLKKQLPVYFGDAKTFKITQAAKKVSAHLHDGGSKVTLIFYNLSASYTLLLEDTQAKVEYFLLRKDLQFLQDQDKTYVAGQLMTNDDEENKNSGYVESIMTLFDVSELNSSSSSFEPQVSKEIRFLLDQPFVNAYGSDDRLLWQTMPLAISHGDQAIGSVIYEEQGTGELHIEFFTSKVNCKDPKEIHYPQFPVTQHWTTDYPLLVYKTFNPKNREIAIVNMAQDVPQKVIHLGDWEFVCFVNHTQMVEQRIFGFDHEVNCDIMMLIRRNGVTRLVSIKTSPWVIGDDISEEEKIEMKKDNEYQMELFMFHGEVSKYMSHDMNGKPISPENRDPRNRRRFNSDKIQTVELLTEYVGNYECYMLMMQFNDCIMMNSLNDETFKMLCNPGSMIKRHILRGYNDQVYYAERFGKSECIYKVQMHNSKRNEYTKTDIFQLSGSWIAAFEADSENEQNDHNQHVKQAFFILDNMQKIHYVVNEDNIRFTVQAVIDISKLGILQEITDLKDNDWSHVCISHRSLCMNNKIYNLNTCLTADYTIPNYYYGQKPQNGSKGMNNDYADMHSKGWVVQSIDGMQETHNTLAVCQKNHMEYCFVLKPAPCSRKQSIVAQQQVYQIDQMMFVANYYILLKLQYGRCVIMHANGDLKRQPDRKIEELLDDPDSQIITNSNFTKRGTRYVLIKNERQSKSAAEAKSTFFLIKFKPDGTAKIHYSFADPTLNMSEIVQGQGISMDCNNKKKKNQQVQMIGMLSDKVKSLVEKQNYKFAKQIIVQPNGKVYIFAFLTCPDKELLAKRKQAEKKAGKLSGDFDKPAYKRQFMTNLHIDKIQDNDKKEQSVNVMLFQCLTKEEQTDFLENNDFTVVDDILVQRSSKEDVAWLTELADINEGSHINQVDSYGLYLTDYMDKEDMDHVQIFEVPPEYHMTVRDQSGDGNLKFYKSIMQIVVSEFAILFDIEDITQPRELATVDQLDQFIDPGCFVITGYRLASSHTRQVDDKTYIEQSKVNPNSDQSLTLRFNKRIMPNGTVEEEVPGILYRTHSYIDLEELKQIKDQLHGSRPRLNDIDPESIISIYEGHTLFSIFFDEIQVFDKVLSQLIDVEFKEEELNGFFVENQFLRKLFSVLMLPTQDLATSKGEKFYVSAENSDNSSSGFITTLKKCFGLSVTKPLQYGKGFRCILNKSIWFENSRFRESLMELSMLCAEQSVTSFVDNLDDLKNLLGSLSPITIKFLENGLRPTRFTRKIQNVDWGIGEENAVLDSITCSLTEQQTEDRLKESFGDETVSTLIDTRMVKIDWVFNPTLVSTSGGFGQLIQVLADCPHESIFRTDFVITITGHFWEYYYSSIFKRAFIPYCIYSALIVSYFSFFLQFEEANERFWPYEFIMRQLIFLFLTYFTTLEVVQVCRDGIAYFGDFQNFMDLSAYICNIFTFVVYSYNLDFVSIETIRLSAAIGVFLVWAKLIYWLRLFSAMSFYIRLIKETIHDIRYFMLVYVIIMLMFGNSLHCLNLNRKYGDEDSSLVQTFFGNSLVDSVYNQYLLSQGEYYLDTFTSDERQDTTAILVFFLLSTFLTSLTILNMIIAIMGDTFGRITEIKEESALREKLTIVADYVFLVGENDDLNKRFIFLMKPNSLSQEVGSMQECVEKITEVVKDISKGQKEEFNEKLTDVQREVQVVDEKLNMTLTELRALQDMKSQMCQMQASQNKQAALLDSLVHEVSKMNGSSGAPGTNLQGKIEQMLKKMVNEKM